MAHPLTSIPNFTYHFLDKELQLTTTEKESTEMFLKAYLDDFWQKGTGSLMPVASGHNASRVEGMFEKRFVFRNIIRECVMRVTGAFFGKAPNWRFRINGDVVERPRTRQTQNQSTDPTQPPDADMQAIDEALGELWTRWGIAEVMSEAFGSRLTFGRGGIRIYLPAKFKRENLVPAEGQTKEDLGASSEQFVAFADIPTAIRAMRVEFVPPTQSRLLDDGGEFFSLVKYSVRRNWETNENMSVIEFSFVDDSNQTFVGTVEERGTVNKVTDANLSSPFNLNGWPTFNEFKGTPYVSAALYRNNQLANLALTCAGFSLVDNGFGEMVLTNVELETETVETDGGPVEMPKRIKRGGGTVQNFVGMETFDEATGAVRRETPGVTFRDAGNLSPFKQGFDLAYAACLQETGQLYALISGDATASGEARIQALTDFLLRIMKYKSEVDELGSWLLTTVMLWAAELANRSLDGVSIVYDSKVHVASLSAPEKTMVMAMRKDGAISRETERVLLGVDDPALEAELVLAEQSLPPEETTVEEFSEKLDVALKMLSISIDTDTIQTFLGYTPAQMAQIKQNAANAEAALLASIDAQNAAASGGAPGPGTVPPADAAAAQGA